MKANFQDEVLRTVMVDLQYVIKEWKKDIDDNQLRWQGRLTAGPFGYSPSLMNTPGNVWL